MPNRIIAATSDIPIKDLSALRKQLKRTEFSAVEAAPAFLDAYHRSPNRAVALARGYAATLKTNEDHRQLFQVVAGLDDTHRRALIKGYREEGQSRGVVQAISLLPRAQGRAVMESLVLKSDGNVDKRAATEVGKSVPCARGRLGRRGADRAFAARDRGGGLGERPPPVAGARADVPAGPAAAPQGPRRARCGRPGRPGDGRLDARRGRQDRADRARG